MTTEVQTMGIDAKEIAAAVEKTISIVIEMGSQYMEISTGTSKIGTVDTEMDSPVLKIVIATGAIEVISQRMNPFRKASCTKYIKLHQALAPIEAKNLQDLPYLREIITRR